MLLKPISLMKGGDTTAPTFDPATYNDATQTLSIPNLSEGGTLVWATSDPANTPTYTIGGGWAGDANYETGSVSVTPGVDATINITGTTPDGSRKLTFYIYDAADNLSSADSEAITVDNTAPTVSTLSPADNATGVAIDANLVMTFSEGMKRQGTVTLKAVGGATIETFDLSTDGTWSTVTNTDDRITLNPAADLSNGADIAVQWSGLEDEFGNALANNATDTTWNFTTVAAASITWADAITINGSNTDDMRYVLSTTNRDSVEWMTGGEQSIDSGASFSIGMSAGTRNLLNAAASFVMVVDIRLSVGNVTDAPSFQTWRDGTSDIESFNITNGNWVVTPVGSFDHAAFADVSSLYGLAAGTVYRIWIAWTQGSTQTRVFTIANDNQHDVDFRNYVVFDRTTFDASDATMDTEIAGIAA